MFGAQVSSAVAVGGRLASFVASWGGERPSSVLCSPCSSGDEVFSVVAVFPDGVRWLRASCLEALSDVADEADVARGVREFKRGFGRLYVEFGATDAAGVAGGFVAEASMGDNASAMTAPVHFLPGGVCVCFESQTYADATELAVLQRTAYSAARTFDALLLRQDAKNAVVELRLLEKRHLGAVSKWAVDGGTTVLRSPGQPIPSHLLLRVYAEGSTTEDVVRIFTGAHDSETMSDSDEEWCEDESSDDEEDESDFDPVEAAEDLANLR